MSKVGRAVALFKQLTEDEQEEMIVEVGELFGLGEMTLMLFDELEPEDRGDVLDAIDESYCSSCFDEFPDGDPSKHTCAARDPSGDEDASSILPPSESTDAVDEAEASERDAGSVEDGGEQHE